MIVLDTDCLTLLEWKGSSAAQILHANLKARNEALTTTIITFEEQMRGWMAYIADARTLVKQVKGYEFLRQNLELFCGLHIVPFTTVSATRYQELRRLKLRIGAMDLKIAAIVLEQNATLISRNLSHYKQIPGLRVEDWTRE